MTYDPLPLIGIIAKLDLKPTDIVVLKTRKPIAHMTSVAIQRSAKAALERVGLNIQVISPTHGSAA